MVLLLRLIGQFAMLLGGLSLVALVGVVAASIVLRLLGSTVPSADDFASIFLAGCIAYGLAAAVASGGHIRVRFFVLKLPPGPRRAIDLGSAVLSIAVSGFLALGLVRIFMTAVVAGSMSLGTIAIPRAVPIGTVMVGMVLLVAALVLHLLIDLSGRAGEIGESETGEF